MIFQRVEEIHSSNPIDYLQTIFFAKADTKRDSNDENPNNGREQKKTVCADYLSTGPDDGEVDDDAEEEEEEEEDEPT